MRKIHKVSLLTVLVCAVSWSVPAQAQITEEEARSDISNFAYERHGLDPIGGQIVRDRLAKLLANPEPYLAVMRQELAVPDDPDSMRVFTTRERLMMLTLLERIGNDEAKAILRDAYRKSARHMDEPASRDVAGFAELVQIEALEALAELGDDSLLPEIIARYDTVAAPYKMELDAYAYEFGVDLPNEVAPLCPTTLAILDFRVAPDDLEYVDLVNTSPDETADLQHCHFVLLDEEVYRVYGFSTPSIAPGDTLRLGATGAARVDQHIGDAKLQDTASSFMIYDQVPPADGTPRAELIDPFPGLVITIASYTDDSAVRELYHRDSTLTARYCQSYAGRLEPGSPAALACGSDAPPPCPHSLAIFDFQVAPGTGQYIDLVNTSTTDAASLGGCSIVLIGDTLSYGAISFEAASLAPGDTLRIGTATTPRVDQVMPDGTFHNDGVGLGLLDTLAVPIGTHLLDITTPFPNDILNSFLYVSNTGIYGWYHRDPAIEPRFCTAYAGRLYPGGFADEECNGASQKRDEESEEGLRSDGQKPDALSRTLVGERKGR